MISENDKEEAGLAIQRALNAVVAEARGIRGDDHLKAAFLGAVASMLLDRIAEATGLTREKVAANYVASGAAVDAEERRGSN